MQKPLIALSALAQLVPSGDLSSHSQCTVQEFYHRRKASLTSLTASFPALDSLLSSGYFLLASSGKISDGLSISTCLVFTGTARGNVLWLVRAASVAGGSDPLSDE